MKLGIVSAIYDGFTFEQMIDHASLCGFECVEVACWPQGKAERRYAGVSHIDVNCTDAEYVKKIKEYCSSHKIQISALAYYPNPMDEDLEKQQMVITHLKKVIQMSALLDVHRVTTFIGRNQHKTIEENLLLFEKIWPPIISYAEEMHVKIAVENCPMLFGKEQWPGGQNLFTTPSLWRKVLNIANSDYFGINYDPSHFIWQQIDYIKPLYEFKDKIFHVHFKDIKLYKEKLDEVGIMAYPLDYMQPKLVGLGDVNWGKFVSALHDIGYDDCSCIEIEDKTFEGSKEKILDSIKLSYHYMRQFVI